MTASEKVISAAHIEYRNNFNTKLKVKRKTDKTCNLSRQASSLLIKDEKSARANKVWQIKMHWQKIT